MIPCTDPTAVMPRRLAYRIEHAKTGLGPFRDTLTRHRKPWGEGPYAMPNPWADRHRRGPKLVSIVGSPALRCAFPSVVALLRWFEHIDLKVCAEDGHVFKVYAVSWVHHTLFQEQIVFNRFHAVCLRTLPIVDTRAWFAPLQADRMAA